MITAWRIFALSSFLPLSYAMACAGGQGLDEADQPPAGGSIANDADAPLGDANWATGNKDANANAADADAPQDGSFEIADAAAAPDAAAPSDAGLTFTAEPPNEGTACSEPSAKTTVDYYGTLTKLDTTEHVVYLETSYAYNWLGKPVTLPKPMTCQNASFVCGDLKAWSGAVGKAPELYLGAICGVSIIDDKTVAIHYGNGNSKVNYTTPKLGQTLVYMHWQACGGTSYMIASCS